METERASGHDIHTSPPLHCKEENDEHQEEEDAVNNAIDLKKRISGHPLYELFVQTHLDCLKAGGVDTGDLGRNDSKDMKQVPGAPTLDESTELDQFMEAYCLALGKLKEAIEEPQQDSMVFINNVHLQFKELTAYSHPPEPTTATVLTSENDSVQDREGRPGIMRAGLGRRFSDDFGLSINFARVKSRHLIQH